MCLYVVPKVGVEPTRYTAFEAGASANSAIRANKNDIFFFLYDSHIYKIIVEILRAGTVLSSL